MGTEKRIRQYIKTWEKRCYPEGIPDEAPRELESAALVPSYRRICLALIRNDLTLKTLGLSQPKSQLYGKIKRAEIEQRNKNK